MAKPRRRYKQLTTLPDRLAFWASKVREQADKLNPGPEKDALLKKVTQAEEACQFDNWVNSSQLRKPK
jgi:hypothetical protein